MCGGGGATSALSGIEAKIKDNTYSVVRGSSLFSSGIISLDYNHCLSLSEWTRERRVFNCTVYHIAGNFCMVQNFAVFADRSAAAKLRITNFLIFI